MRVSVRWQAVFIFLISFHGLLAAAAWFAPRFTAIIPSSAIAPEHGAAYVAPVHFSGNVGYVLPTDVNGAPDSRLALFENDKPLGPAQVLHSEIRRRGSGRYSHWYDTILFSTSDGTDPRTNGRIYSLASPTKINPAILTPLSIVLLILDLGLFLAFRQQITLFFQSNSRYLSLSTVPCVLMAIVLVGLAAFGFFGPIAIAGDGPPKDLALILMAIAHALLGCLIWVFIWAGGTGVARAAVRNANASFASVVIPGFPIGLVLAALLVTIVLLVPHGWALAVFLWLMCLGPLVYWPLPKRELVRTVGAAAAIMPLALTFGVWLGLLWHGPTATLPGSPSGDLVHYASASWALAARPFPFVDLAYANGPTINYFNMLFSALGAVLTNTPGFDSFLYVSSGGGTSYVFLTAIMLHVFVADRAPMRPSFAAIVLLLLSFIGAARYPYWVIESIPMVFTPALIMTVWWMIERSHNNLGWGAAAMVVAVVGPALSKVVTAAILVPLAAMSVLVKLRTADFLTRAFLLIVASCFAIYAALMLSHYLPMFLALAKLGPDSLVKVQWWFAVRDGGTLALAALAWRIADRPVALALTIGLATFLAFAWAFQANYVCVVFLLGIIAFGHPERLAKSRPLAFVAFGSTVPAALASDPAGLSSGVVWVFCLGGAILVAILAGTYAPEARAASHFRLVLRYVAATCAIAALALAGVGRGHILVSSGWNPGEPELTPEVRDVWLAVRDLTPFDGLIFTDQTGDIPLLLEGWNLYALSGQRQIYLASYYAVAELRYNPVKRGELLATNEAVLRGELSVLNVPTHRSYTRFFAVVSRSRSVPATWPKVYENGKYVVYSIPSALRRD